MVAPSGEQYELRNGDHVAVVVGVGGGIRRYFVGDRQILDGYDVDEQCDGARGQTLVPWPNRVQDGKWRHGDEAMQLALTEPEQHNAIHGLVRWMPWVATAHDESSVRLTVTSYPQPGYPWALEVSNVWALEHSGLSVTTTIVNRSETAAPVAAGFHPYLSAGAATIDDAVLTLPAETRLINGAQQIPTGSEPVANTAYDFRDPRRIGDLHIDYAFTDLQRAADGRCRLHFTDSAGGNGMVLWVDEAYHYLEIFTGDTLPRPLSRRRGLGVEPMSAPPNALATGESLVRLEPGAQWVGSWGIDPT